MSYKVKLDIFEGPFDLLVYLIENAEMSIYDINVSEIVTQYVEYIEQMQKMDIPVATEFMVLAASLIEIKSKMLLPRVSTGGDEAAVEDPRTELVQKLIEYKRFKAAAEMLAESEAYTQRIFEKPQEDISAYENKPDEYLKMDIAQFVNAFNLFLRKKKRLDEVKKRYTKLERQRISVEHKISFISSFFINDDDKQSITFTELVESDRDKYNVVTTFTSLLEMAKSRAVGLVQPANFAEITVTRGENIDKINAAEMAAEQQKEAAVNDR